MQQIAFLLLIGCCVFIYDVTASQEITGIRILDGVCLTKRTDRLVYRHKNNTHVYIAFDILKRGVVDVFTWKIIAHNTGTYISSRVKIETVPAVDFRKNVTRKHIIGATGRRHEDSFRHRVERKMKNCKKIRRKKKKNCKVVAIQSLFVRLKMRKASFDTKKVCDNDFK